MIKKSWWWTWTVERPAAFGDWLWLILVVLPAEFLDRLTLRKVIAFLPLAIFAIAFAHNIPLPPEVVFVGDALAYLDILTILFLLTAIGRAGTLLYFVRQAVGSMARWLAQTLPVMVRRSDSRHSRARRESGRKCLSRWFGRSEDDGVPLVWGALA
jgi:hypothetical protein